MPEQITTIIDYRLRVRLSELPPGVAEHIMEALSIPNLAKQKALDQFVWGAERMPDTIELYEIEGEYLVMPRGFAADYAQGMRDMGLEITWTDRRQFEAKFRIGQKPNLHPWQISAVQVMKELQQGIYKAPAGSGKTVAVLALIQQLACKSLIIISALDVAWQWRARAIEHLGEHYPVSQIGDQIFDVSSYLTVATAQTLSSRFDALEAEGFFDQFSLVCLDECHHAQADTYRRLLDRFSARYRLGVSATPEKTGAFALAVNVLGPIIHETKSDAVDTLQKPEVVRIPTKFRFGFQGRRGRYTPSNWPQLIQALVSNQERNQIIVNTIVENAGHHQLVVSKRLEHLDILHSMLIDEGFADPIVTITGQDSNEARQEAKALAETSPCVLLSTLADEAMDIPRLDRLHLPFPQRNAGLVTQQVGRIERKHPDKKCDGEAAAAVIFDYTDNVGPLEAQWRVRHLEVYKRRGYRVTTRRAQPV
jgi:superfamily II DNA or RNA helicase